MRTRIIALGIMIVAAACSDSGADRAADSPRADADLALTPEADGVPVASDLEVNRQGADRPEPDVAAPERATLPEPQPEPLGATGATEAVAVGGTGMHEHPKLDTESAVFAPVAVNEEAGRGKPNPGVSEGLGPVPDRNPGTIGVIDEPAAIPVGIAGRTGAVIIRGGAGRIDDDCAIHDRRGRTGGVMDGIRAAAGEIGGIERPGGALVNDRDPRRGSLINERAPRVRNGGALPRGAGLPGRVRGH